MILVEYEAVLVDGVITIPLERPCKCFIGLVDLALPNLNSKNNLIDITCDQIDSTFDNPDRLLRRVPYRMFYKIYGTDPIIRKTQHIKMAKIKSSDKFLTLNFKSTEHGSNINIENNLLNCDHVYLTLAFAKDI